MASPVTTYEGCSQKGVNVTVTIQAISDIPSLLEIQSILDPFVQQQSDSPFLLVSFLEQYMENACSHGWAPLVLLFSVDQKLVALIPLMTSKTFGIRQVTTLSNTFFSDFVCIDAYREVVISKTIDLIFSRLNCQLVSFRLPAESPFVKFLEYECRKRGIRVSLRFWGGDESGLGQAVLPLEGGWHEFAKSRGKKFLQDIHRTERYLSAIGQWRIVRLGEHEAREAFDQITHVERMSWKWADRIKRGEKVNPDDLMLINWRALLQCSRTETGVEWYVCFLQLNGQMIAYVLIVEFRGIFFPIFTSYGQEHARFGPGIYLLNMLIRDSFEKRLITKIDFLSDVAFTRTWAPTNLKRVTLMMAPKNNPTRIIASLYPTLSYLIFPILLSSPKLNYILNTLKRSRHTD